MSATSLGAILSVAILTIFIPVVLLVVWCTKKKTKPFPALAGALIFMLFAQTLETIPHMFFLATDNSFSRILTSTPALYAVYAALVAGIFEETGRFAAFHLLKNKFPGKKTAITYGLGHGGFECMSIVGFGFLQYYSIGLMIQKGTINTILSSYSGEQLANMETAISGIASMTVGTCLVVLLERAYTLVFHIALSVLVYHSVHITGKKWLFPVSILLHAALALFVGLYQAAVLPLIVTETMGMIFTVLVVFWAYRIYTANKEEDVI